MLIVQRNRLAAIVVAALLLGTSVACGNRNRALRFGTSSYADTDFDLGRIIGREHSVSFRFMLEYPNSYWNVMLGEAGSNAYAIGKTVSTSDSALVLRLYLDGMLRPQASGLTTAQLPPG